MPRQPRSWDDALRRFQSLEGNRGTFDNHCQQITELMWPERADFTTKDRTRGSKRNTIILDNTALIASMRFQAVMSALNTPATSRWHGMRSTDDELNKLPEVKAYFEEVTRVLFSARNDYRSGFQLTQQDVYKSHGVLGNACKFIDEPVSGAGIRYSKKGVASTYIEQNAQGIVDTVFSVYELSARAAYENWKDDPDAKMPPSVARDAEDPTKQDNPHRFLHAVFPRQDYDPERKDAKGMRFVSYHGHISDKHQITEGGYEEQPYIFSRYTVNDFEVYGRGPGWSVLGSVQMLQEMQRAFVRSAHKAIDPPILTYGNKATGSGSMAVRLDPGQQTPGYISERGELLARPFMSGARLEIAEGMIERERAVVNAAFMTDLFQILTDGPQMTAYEVAMRMQEKGHLIAPQIARLQAEDLGPTIDREYGIAERQGWLPDLPPVLIEAGVGYEVIYESAAMRMQRGEELAGIEAVFAATERAAQYDQGIMDKLDLDRALEITQEIGGAPSEIWRDPDDYAARRQQRAEAAAQQAQLAQAAAAAPAMKDLAQAGQATGA